MPIIGQPQIDELVGFLNTFQPEKNKKLEQEFPQYTNLLKVGQELGESDIDDDRELRFRAKVCASGLNAIIEKCEKEFPTFKTKLKEIKNLQLYAQLVTAISGASVLTTLSNENRTFTYVAGTLSLIGSLVPLIVKAKNQGLNENRQLDVTYGELVQMKLSAETNLSELNFFIENCFNKDGIAIIINKSNQLAVEIKEKLSFF